MEQGIDLFKIIFAVIALSLAAVGILQFLKPDAILPYWKVEHPGKNVKGKIKPQLPIGARVGGLVFAIIALLMLYLMLTTFGQTQTPSSIYKLTP